MVSFSSFILLSLAALVVVARPVPDKALHQRIASNHFIDIRAPTPNPIDNSTTAVVPPVQRRSSPVVAKRCAAKTNTTTTLTATTHVTASSTTTHQTTTTSTTAKSTSSAAVSENVASFDSSASIFPVSGASQSWTTDSSLSGALTLDDETLNITDDIESLPHPYVQWEGKTSIQSYFPEGSIDPASSEKGGISFYSYGPISLASAKEATFAYSVYFEEGFDFNMGGKLPGMYGGDSDADAIGCSGGRKSTNCFSVRMMWRTDGMGELYAYLPPLTSNNNAFANTPPLTILNPEYGSSVGRGSFTFPTGAWTTISQRVLLNDVGQENGEVQIWVNGKSVINVGGLIFRVDDNGAIRGGQFQCFFGGHTSEWASPKDQSLYLSDVSAAIIQSL